jgi:DNA-binding MarR family transcriptional regulator
MELEMEMDLDIRIPLVVVFDKALPAMTKIVYGVLRSFCPLRSTICAPSVIELGKQAGIDAPNVIPHLARLRKAKYIKIDRPGRRNRYTFLK